MDRPDEVNAVPAAFDFSAQGWVDRVIELQ